MSITQGTTVESSSFALANTAPVGGAATWGDGVAVNEGWSSGTGDRQFNKGGAFTFTIAALGTQLIDLKTDLGVDGVALALVECRLLKIQADDTNISKVTVEVDATDGWTAWMTTVGDIIDLEPGETTGFTHSLDGGKLVSGTNKQLLLTNTDAANAAIVRVVIVGVDA